MDNDDLKQSYYWPVKAVFSIVKLLEIFAPFRKRYTLKYVAKNINIFNFDNILRDNPEAGCQC